MNSYVDALKDLTPDEQAEINAIAAMLENQPESLDDDPFDGPPIPFMEFARLPFPIEAFPDWLYDMATATAITYQVPVDMAGMILLSVLAAAVSKRYRIQARQGWVELLGHKQVNNPLIILQAISQLPKDDIVAPITNLVTKQKTTSH
jgi:hypothetical protein